MKHRRWLQLAAALSAITLVAAACGGDDDDDAATDTTDDTTEATGEAPSELTLAALLPETGQLSAIVESLRTPIDIAIEEINAAGGVFGADVQTIAADDGTDPNVASTSFDQLLSDGANVIIGPASSGTMLGIVDKVKDSEVVVCSGSNTSAELSTADDGGKYFRTAPPDALQGPALAEVVLADGHTKVGVVVRNDSYGTGFGEALQQGLEDGGAEVVADVAYDPESATGYGADVDQVIAAAPEAVVVIGFNDDGGKIISTMIEKGAGPADLPIYTADGMQGSTFFEAVDKNNPAVVEGIKGTAPAASPSGVDHPFQAKFAETGVDPIFSSYYYDCVNILTLAAEVAQSTEADAIAAEVIGVTEDGEQCQTFEECKALLDEGEDIDYEGASGSNDMTEVGEPTSGAYEIWQYDAEGAPVTLDVDQIKIEQ